MKRQFFKELNRKLRRLRKAERKKYIESYDEMIADKTEHGYSEESAIKSFGTVDDIAEKILKAYEKKETGVSGIKYFNIWYMVGDMLSFCSAIIIVLIFYLKKIEMGSASLHRETQYSIIIFCMAAICFFLYYLLGLYSFEGTKNYGKEIKSIVYVNGISTVIVFIILYFLKWVFVSRMLILIFSGINMFFGIGVRGIFRNL